MKGLASTARKKICTGKLDNKCWGLPLIQLASWKWGVLAWNRIGSIRMTKLGLHPERSLGVPNMESLLSEMQLNRYVAIADDRFGRVSRIPGLAKFPLTIPGAICSVWKKSNENPILSLFSDALEKYCSGQDQIF